MIVDLHVHTRFSYDSDVDMSQYCELAIQRGVDAVCFTDHIDYDVHDYGYGYYNATEFFKQYQQVRNIYDGRLQVLCGVEFGEPHIYREQLSRLRDYPYDFIIGSIHWWYKNLFPSIMVRNNESFDDVCAHYWDSVHAAVSAGGFDAIGHFDFPKRYFGKKCVWDQDKIAAIFRIMRENGITLEINTSSMRQGLTEPMPGDDMIEIYKSCGGLHVTAGSDAHFVQDIAADIGTVKQMISTHNLREVYYKQRQLCVVS